MSRILAIDDKEDNLTVISALLENRIHNCNVITAQSGAEGLKKAKAESPDTILLDIRMPGMDGYEVCKRLKEDESTRHIPVIMLTAVKIGSGDRVSGLEAGADAYLAKPVDESVLIAHVNATLRIKRAEDALRKQKDSLEEIVQERVRELRESEERYRFLAENARDVIWTMDMDLMFTYISPSVISLCGYSVEEIINRKLEKFITPASFEVATQVIEEAPAVEKLGEKDRGETWMMKLEIICKDGSTVWTETATGPVYDKNGRAVEILGITRDITERKRAEEEKAKLQAQFQQAQKMESIGTLAGGVAHDFNNLLMGIQGYVSLMLMGVDSTHTHYEMLTGIEEQVQKGAELTRHLLSFARGEKYEVNPTDLNELIKKSSSMFGRTKKEIKIHRKYQKDIYTVDVDRGQIEQVLMNLYVDAWQAMPDGGELYLQTENVTLDENYIEPFQVEPGKYVKISVTDTGVGMNEETQQRIFEPFFTTKEMGKGTGLGLASAYGIIKNHDGFINVYSKKGEGTTFKFYLPASEKEVVEEKESGGKVLKGSETVLLVDDEDVIVDVDEQFLQKMGYAVLIARSGKEAIEIYEKGKDKIDLIILDMIMPDMSGRESYGRIREINPDVKVLLSSGYSINGQATQILEQGCNGFIQKPFNMKGLSQKLREILDN
ncbi:MAG: response regulator [Deltaproteobacteria bacterium]|nr:response regulator [Deltaproteobacteria bacterium]